MGLPRLFGLTAVTVVSGVVAALSGAACGGLYGEEAGDQLAGDAGLPTQTDASTEAVAPLLNCPTGCVPPAPSGWTGPSAVYDGAYDTKPAQCPPLYAEKQLEGRDGVMVGTASCVCGTGTPQGGKCKVVVSDYASTTCDGNAIGVPHEAPLTKCVNRGGGFSTMRVAAPTIIPPTCAFPQSVVTGPPLSFERAVVACALPERSACAEQGECLASPVPSDPFTRMCIHRVGDQSCPSADYAARFTVFAAVRDGRACACYATPASASCGTKVDFYSGTGCNGAVSPSSVDSCTDGASVDISPLGPFATGCEVAEQSTVIGEVALVDVTTFCCTK